MQQDAHLARLFGSAAIPLTLVAQGTGTATADAGCIHHAQASIGFSAPLMDTKRLASRTAQRPLWLGEKILSSETARFLGESYFSWPIPLWGRRRDGSLILHRGEDWSKLGRAHRIGMELVAQFQA